MEYSELNMTPGDELATLFSRNMTFAQPQPTQHASPEQFEFETEPIKYSITQHYHHSAHIVNQEEAAAAAAEDEDTPVLDAAAQRASSVPPQTTQVSVEYVLRNNGIDPAGLSLQQMQLFKTADEAQQIRLLELWKIYPPTNNASQMQYVDPGVAWSNTTVEQEEVLAQLRHEQMLAERESQRNSLMSLDGTPLTPVQSSEGHWVHWVSNAASSSSPPSSSSIEPYMMSGYEMLAQREYEESAKRQLADEAEMLMGSEPKEMSTTMMMGYHQFGNYRLATDPVYAVAVHDDWPNQKQAMENQYGAYQQMSEMEF
ncbi:hypothetical protein GGR50DRAFT_50413 [Xylaria sp. CBS 124048]|nr:hypothetical protein GGR50DRAFT_50413 [Xylaria sp. CBS 124048]